MATMLLLTGFVCRVNDIAGTIISTICVDIARYPRSSDRELFFVIIKLMTGSMILQ